MAATKKRRKKAKASTKRRKTTKRKTTKRKTKKAASRKTKARKTTKRKTTRKKTKVKAKTRTKTKAKKRKTGKKRKPNAAFMRPLTPSTALGMIVGASPLPRTQAVKKVWQYIKRKGLQDKIDRRMINPDAVLKNVVRKAKLSMFELTKYISNNLK